MQQELDTARSTVHVEDRSVGFLRAGDGPPVLLLHGWGGSVNYWRPTMAALGDALTLIAPELPGFAGARPLDEPATPERLAGWVIAFADALGIERFDLNGHSFSGGVAAHIAAAYPERVRRLILTGFSTFRNEPERLMVESIHNVLTLWMALRRPWMAEKPMFYTAVGGRFFYRLPEDSALLRASFRDFLLMDSRTALESAASAGDPKINRILRSISAPSLLIAGRQDEIMPPPGVPEVARLVPDCRLAWIERCGHLPMIERPELYQRLLREFLVAAEPPPANVPPPGLHPPLA